MSRKNSKEEKARRRLENAWKATRYTPIPTPEEYINHFTFIPDEPFFYNSAIAARGEEDFAFRTKNQLVDFVENIDFPMKKVVTKAGKSFVEVSVYFHTDAEDCVKEEADFSEEEAKKIGFTKYEGDDFGGVLSMKKAKKGNVTALYLVRHRIIDGDWIKDQSDYTRKNPRFSSLNTLWVPLDEVKNLPTGLFTDDERIHYAKMFETLQPLDEEELERLFSASNGSSLKENYETNEEGEIIIEEFFNEKGQSIGFQPKKKRESWLRTFHAFPVTTKGKKLMIGIEPDTSNLLTGQVND